MSAPNPPVAQPVGVDETSIFIVEPSGWYGVLSMRSPFIRRGPARPGDTVELADYQRWLPKILSEPLGQPSGIDWVSCVPVMQCWYSRFSDGDRNDYAMTMLQSVSTVHAEIKGIAIFTGQGDGAGTPIGLRPEQLEPLAAAYRMAQRKLLARD